MARRTRSKFVVDEKGSPVAVLVEIEEYRRMASAAEELEAIRAFDEAKASGERPIPFEKAIAAIERKRR